jgi:adenosylmethionine-8-amino-7-oxononanoate aminotransferase
MKTAAPPRQIVRGSGALLIDSQGNQIIDAVSSWWVSIHGHAHPKIADRLYRQAQQLEQVIFAGFTHSPATELSRRLRPLLPNNQSRVFFSDDGSTAVEVALKMAIQYCHNTTQQTPHIIAFENGYHGDTFGAMSVSHRGAFVAPFRNLLFDVTFIPAPSTGQVDRSLEMLQEIVGKPGPHAFIYEPLVQGAGGMLMHEPQALNRLLNICHDHNVITIADEVLTGFGRTGTMFASQQLSFLPRIMCLSKGLTGGTLPMGMTTCDESIYSAFLSNDHSQTFFHGHSFTGNPLGCAAALASLDILEEAECQTAIRRIEQQHADAAATLSCHSAVDHVRQRGVILAIEIKTSQGTSYFNQIRDRLYDFFLSRHVLLRPLGNVVYILPPYCISEQQLERVYSVIREALDAIEAGTL